MEAKLFVEFTALPGGGYEIQPAVFDPNSDEIVKESHLRACRTDIREVDRYVGGILSSWAREVDEVRRQQSIDDATNVTRLEHHRPTLFQRMFG